MKALPTLKAGNLCYYDSLRGMIPARVISIKGKSGINSTDQECELLLTSRDRRGQTIQCSGLHAIRRDHHKPGTGRIIPHHLTIDGE